MTIREILRVVARKIMVDCACAIAINEGAVIFCPDFTDTAEPLQWYEMTVMSCPEPVSVRRAINARIEREEARLEDERRSTH